MCVYVCNMFQSKTFPTKFKKMYYFYKNINLNVLKINRLSKKIYMSICTIIIQYRAY